MPASIWSASIGAPGWSESDSQSGTPRAGNPSREACHDLIGKPGILVCDGGPERFGGKADGGKLDVGKADGSKFVLNGDGGGEGPIMEEGSKTEPGIGTHSPFGIAVVDIAHEGMGLDLSVAFYGDRGKGNFKSLQQSPRGRVQHGLAIRWPGKDCR